MTQSQIQFDPLKALLESHQQAFDGFAQLLIEENQKYNLTRITDIPQIRIRHFLDGLTAIEPLDSLAAKTGHPLKIIDVGSGAGFPSLVLAIVRPEWSICSLEATGKKAHFQQMVCDKLGLENVRVIHGRAEDIAHQPPYRERFDVACARAVAAMPMLAELLLGFASPKGGQAFFWKGSGAEKEMVEASPAIRQMGAEVMQIHSYTLPEEKEDRVEFSLVICQKTKPTPKQYPRPFGIIKKKPLG